MNLQASHLILAFMPVALERRNRWLACYICHLHAHTLASEYTKRLFGCCCCRHGHSNACFAVAEMASQPSKQAKVVVSGGCDSLDDILCRHRQDDSRETVEHYLPKCGTLCNGPRARKLIYYRIICVRVLPVTLDRFHQHA